MEKCSLLFWQTTAQEKVICSAISFEFLILRLIFVFTHVTIVHFKLKQRELLHEKTLKSEGVVRFTKIAAIICV